jgi:hypothetical protein
LPAQVTLHEQLVLQSIAPHDWAPSHETLQAPSLQKMLPQSEPAAQATSQA